MEPKTESIYLVTRRCIPGRMQSDSSFHSTPMFRGGPEQPAGGKARDVSTRMGVNPRSVDRQSNTALQIDNVFLGFFMEFLPITITGRSRTTSVRPVSPLE